MLLSVFMNTTLDFYPGTNGTGEANREDGDFPILDYNESAFSQRFEASILADVNSEELIRELLRRIGEDPHREGLRQTPARIIRSWHELFSGYDKRADDVLATQFHAEQYRRDGASARCRIRLYLRASYAAILWRGTHRLHSRPKNCRLVETSTLTRCLCPQTPGTGTPDPANCQ